MAVVAEDDTARVGNSPTADAAGVGTAADGLALGTVVIGTPVPSAPSEDETFCLHRSITTDTVDAGCDGCDLTVGDTGECTAGDGTMGTEQPGGKAECAVIPPVISDDDGGAIACNTLRPEEHSPMLDDAGAVSTASMSYASVGGISYA